MITNKLAKYFLRVGLAFVYVYATVEIHIHPENFIKYVPDFVVNMIPMDLFLPVFAVLEMALAIWLLTGWKGVYPSILSFMMMVGIIVFNMEYFQILFRNVAIGFGCLALLALEWNEKEEVSATRQVTQLAA